MSIMAHNRDRVNLIEPGRLHAAITFARASTGTYVGPDGLLHTAAANAPRYEYDASGNYLGLLMEVAATNRLLYSQDFTQTNWLKTTATLPGSPSVAPDGTMTASLLTASGTNAALRNIQTVAASTLVINSVYVKMGTAPCAYIQINQVNAASANIKATFICVNLTTLAFGVETDLVGGGLSGFTNLTATPSGNGFIRISFQYTTTATTATQNFYFFGCDSLTSRNLTVGETITGWGANVTTGSSVVGTYIPSTSATVTRAQDTAIITSLPAIGYSASAGTLLMTLDSQATAVANSPGLVTIDDGTTANRIILSRGLTPTSQQFIGRQSTASATQQSSSAVNSWLATDNGAHRIAYGWDSGGTGSGAFDGVATANTSSAVPTGLIDMRIGAANTTSNGALTGHFKSLTYYPRRLPDVEMQRLTA